MATQQRLLSAVRTQFNKAPRNEAGHIYDLSPAEIKAAKDFLETPEVKDLAADVRELFRKNAAYMRDTKSISEDTYKKFTDPKYAYSPLYMSIEDLEAALPAAPVYIQGGLRQTVTVKGLKGSQQIGRAHV